MVTHELLVKAAGAVLTGLVGVSAPTKRCAKRWVRRPFAGRR